MVIWIIVYRNEPGSHSWITLVEVSKISTDKDPWGQMMVDIPWKGIFKSTSIWAILFATFGNMLSIQVMIFYTPTYLVEAFRFDFQNSGILVAVPFFIQFLIKLLAGNA